MVYLHRMFIRVLIIFSGASHIFYGITALIHPFFIDEYARYGFSDQRIAIGIIQSILGLTLLLGLSFDKLKVFASICLSVMMAGAFGTRVFIGDSIIQSIPSVAYFLINLTILGYALNNRK